MVAIRRSASLLVTLLLVACDPAADRVGGATVAARDVGEPVVHRFGGPTMGSTYEVKYTADVPVERVRAVVEAELAAYNLAFSQWRDDSEIANSKSARLRACTLR